MTSLIITAAGKASRFHDVGYDMPKYLLPWINSKSILKNIIDELTFSNLIDFILVIVNKREQFFEETIRNELPNGIIQVIRQRHLGASPYNFIGCGKS